MYLYKRTQIQNFENNSMPIQINELGKMAFNGPLKKRTQIKPKLDSKLTYSLILIVCFVCFVVKITKQSHLNSGLSSLNPGL
jgi:hypothetical protein